MVLDEGYVKYDSRWTQAPASQQPLAALLERWRQPLYRRGLIGYYEEFNVGYGNMSVRIDSGSRFLISGTQTGHLNGTSAQHYAVVTDYDIAANRVSCQGPVQASSEAMTHASLYELDLHIGAVVHVHDKALWRHFLNTLPTTHATVPYGTPQMAAEFSRLYKTTVFSRDGLAIMAGHDEGIVSIGNDLASATKKLIDLYDQFKSE